MKKHLMTIIIVAVFLLVIGMVWFVKANQPLQTNDSKTVLSVQGLHGHPQLEIYVKGVKMPIPQNVGIGAVHAPVHTHDDVPIIHLEFPGTLEG